jgi:hypothetical protein
MAQGRLGQGFSTALFLATLADNLRKVIPDGMTKLATRVKAALGVEPSNILHIFNFFQSARPREPMRRAMPQLARNSHCSMSRNVRQDRPAIPSACQSRAAN